MPNTRHRTESRTSPRRIEAVGRQRQALELRKAGATFHAIAEALGFAHATGAQAAVETALRKTLQEPADECRLLDLERLDTMLLSIWPNVRRGELGAIDRALKVLERRATLLGYDLYKPQSGAMVGVASSVTVLVKVGEETVSLAEMRRQAIALNDGSNVDGAAPWADCGPP